MAAKARTRTNAVAALSELEEKPYAYDFFWTLRYLECLHDDKPRFGEAARPIDEPVRVTQEPSLAFAPSTLAKFTAGTSGAPHRLSAYFFGLFGPHGPLPLHLTEYVRERELNDGDPTLRRFADLFHHRFMLAFYRAWANSNPAASLDRPAPRRFDTYVGSVFGLSPELRSRDAVPDSAKLYLSGLFGMKSRPAKALVAILEEFLELPFKIREFVGAWMRLPAGDWPKLGASPEVSALGVNMVVGSAIWQCQHRFRLVCGPLRFDDFRRLLPGAASVARLRDLVRSFVGDEFEWDLNLVLLADDVPALELGVAGQLGWTSWLGARGSTEDAADVIVNPAALIEHRVPV